MVVQDCADYNGEELKRRADLLNDLLVLIRRCGRFEDLAR